MNRLRTGLADSHLPFVVIAAYGTAAIPYFKGGLKGLARSMPTSGAIDRYGDLQIPILERTCANASSQGGEEAGSSMLRGSHRLEGNS